LRKEISFWGGGIGILKPNFFLRLKKRAGEKKNKKRSLRGISMAGRRKKKWFRERLAVLPVIGLKGE